MIGSTGRSPPTGSDNGGRLVDAINQYSRQGISGRAAFEMALRQFDPGSPLLQGGTSDAGGVLNTLMRGISRDKTHPTVAPLGNLIRPPQTSADPQFRIFMDMDKALKNIDEHTRRLATGYYQSQNFRPGGIQRSSPGYMFGGGVLPFSTVVGGAPQGYGPVNYGTPYGPPAPTRPNFWQRAMAPRYTGGGGGFNYTGGGGGGFRRGGGGGAGFGFGAGAIGGAAVGRFGNLLPDIAIADILWNVVNLPQDIARMEGRAIAGATPHINFTESMYNLARGAGYNPVNMAKQIFPAYGLNDISHGIFQTSRIMRPLGLTPEMAIQSIQQMGGLRPGDDFMKNVTINRAASLAGTFVNMPEGTVEGIRRWGRGIGYETSSNPLSTIGTMALVLGEALTRTMDQSKVLESIKTATEITAKAGGSIPNLEGVSDIFSRTLNFNTPGARSGQMATDIMGGLSNTLSQGLSNPIATTTVLGMLGSGNLADRGFLNKLFGGKLSEIEQNNPWAKETIANLPALYKASPAMAADAYMRIAQATPQAFFDVGKNFAPKFHSGNVALDEYTRWLALGGAFGLQPQNAYAANMKGVPMKGDTFPSYESLPIAEYTARATEAIAALAASNYDFKLFADNLKAVNNALDELIRKMGGTVPTPGNQLLDALGLSGPLSGLNNVTGGWAGALFGKAKGAVGALGGSKLFGNTTPTNHAEFEQWLRQQDPDNPKFTAAAALIAEREDPNLNPATKNYKYQIWGKNAQGVPVGFTASGLWQQLATNWHKYGQGIVDFDKYPEAYMAPRELQYLVWKRQFAAEGYKPWSMSAGGSFVGDQEFEAGWAKKMEEMGSGENYKASSRSGATAQQMPSMSKEYIFGKHPHPGHHWFQDPNSHMWSYQENPMPPDPNASYFHSSVNGFTGAIDAASTALHNFIRPFLNIYSAVKPGNNQASGP